MVRSLGLSRGRAVAALGALVVLAVVLVLVLTRDSDGSGSTDATDDPTSGSSGPSATISSTPGDDPSPSDGASTDGPGPDDGADPSGGPTAKPRTVRVPLDATGRASRTVTVKATKYEWVDGQTRVRGETGGPSIRVTLVARNDSGRVVDIGSALVNAYYGPDDTPASPLSAPGGKPFPSTVKPGGTAMGRFVFQMPQREQVRVRIEVYLDDRLTVVNFVGEPGTVM